MRQRGELSVFTLIVAMLLLSATSGEAQQRYPYYPGGMPYPYGAQPGQQRYQPPSPYGQPQPPGYPGRPPAVGEPSPRGGDNSSGIRPPDLRAPPQAWPPQGYAPYRTAAAPELEVSISEQRLYAQQGAIVTVELISEGNVGRIEVDLPSSDALLLNRLEGPITEARNRDGKQLIVNRYYYALTPLKVGQFSIPVVQVSGSLADGRNSTFELRSPSSTLLTVAATDPSVRPWLPLHGLTLNARLQDAERPEAGRPMTLVVETSAIGATGSQLPSFTTQLQGGEYHLYREKTATRGGVSSDGRYLIGTRTETFTLVPQNGGRLLIPSLEIDWWNVETERAERSFSPIRQLLVLGEPGAKSNQITDLFPGASKLLLWVPLIGMFLATIGFWVMAWLRNKRFMQVVEEEFWVVVAFVADQIRAFLIWLSPIRRLQKVRQLFVGSLPRSFRLWFCVKVVDGEDDPEVWSYMLKFLANKHLGIPPQMPLQSLGEELCAIHMRADAAQMRDLMQQLDAALYGSGTVDFTAWKRDFRRQLRPVWLRLPRRQRSPAQPKRQLPDLNPG